MEGETEIETLELGMLLTHESSCPFQLALHRIWISRVANSIHTQFATTPIYLCPKGKKIRKIYGICLIVRSLMEKLHTRFDQVDSSQINWFIQISTWGNEIHNSFVSFALQILYDGCLYCHQSMSMSIMYTYIRSFGTDWIHAENRKWVEIESLFRKKWITYVHHCVWSREIAQKNWLAYGV